MLLDYGCRPLEVEVVPVAFAKRNDLLRGKVRLRDQLGQLVEEVLEPDGLMISRILHGVSPAFQNVCHWLRGLKTKSPSFA